MVWKANSDMDSTNEKYKEMDRGAIKIYQSWSRMREQYCYLKEKISKIKEITEE